MRMTGVMLLVLWPSVAVAQMLGTCGSGVEMIRHEATLDADFENAGRAFRIDPDLGRAIAMEESRFVANAISAKGAMGLMQLMPETSGTMGVRDPFDAHQNIYGGMKYLRFLADDPRFADDPYMVLVAYGAGPNHGNFPQAAYRAADVITATYWQLKARRSRGLIIPVVASYFRAPVCGQHEAKQAKPVRFDRNGKLLPTRHYPTS